MLCARALETLPIPIKKDTATSAPTRLRMVFTADPPERWKRVLQREPDEFCAELDERDTTGPIGPAG